MAKKKKGGKKEPKVNWDVNADIHQKKFLEVYALQLEKDKSAPSPWLVQAMKDGIENRLYVKKFMILPEDPSPEGEPPNLPIHIEPIINALRKAHFVYFNELCIWDFDKLSHRAVAAIALLVERGVFPLTKIELMDCDITYYSIGRLANSFKVSTLVEVNLDYNEFGDEGCRRLCDGLKTNMTIQILSLCYCRLTKHSGSCLGDVAYGSMVREFYLDGNNLQCVGVIELVRRIADAAEEDHARRIEDEKLKELMKAEGPLAATDRALTSQIGGQPGSGSEHQPTSGNETEGKPVEKKKKKGKGKKKKKEKEEPPEIGPFIKKLHLVDNGIDNFCIDNETEIKQEMDVDGGADNFSEDKKKEDRHEVLAACVGVLSRLIAHSHCLRELNMDDNVIGNLCSLQVFMALEKRKQGKLPGLKMRISPEIQKDIFSAIMKLASGKAGKKGKKKGRKKKKK